MTDTRQLTTGRRRPTWATARHLFATEFAGLAYLFGVYVVAVAAAAALYSWVAPIEGSAWEIASTVPRWYILAIGAYAAYRWLPLHVAHGQTRRRFAVEGSVFLGAMVSGLTVLMTLGYLAERLVYGALDLPQALSGTHLFDHPTQVGLVLLEFWLLFAVWGAVGALAAAAFYRHVGLGALLVPVGFLVVSAVEVTVGTGYIGPLPPFLERWEWPLAAVTVSALTICAVVLAATWLVVRDMPVRNHEH